MDLASFIQLSGLLVAVIALCWTAYGVYLNRKIKQAEFWMQLRVDFSKYDEVHSNLRPGGKWWRREGPNTVEEWVKVEGYMGLFEHCEIMLKQGLLDESVFADSYKYRIANIVSNESIRQAKLIKHAQGWERFIELCKRLELPITP